MSFLDHLRELGRRLIISLIAVLVGTVVCYIFYDSIVAVLFRPFRLISAPTGNETLYIQTLFQGFLIRLKISIVSGIILSLACISTISSDSCSLD